MEARRLEDRNFIRGEVHCDDVANSRAVHRFVQKWVGRWIASKRPTAPRDRAHFHVRFARQGEGHTVSCEIRLKLDKEQYVGASFGENLSEALARSLSHMLPARSA